MDVFGIVVELVVRLEDVGVELVFASFDFVELDVVRALDFVLEAAQLDLELLPLVNIVQKLE